MGRVAGGLGSWIRGAEGTGALNPLLSQQQAALSEGSATRGAQGWPGERSPTVPGCQTCAPPGVPPPFGGSEDGEHAPTAETA